MGMGTLVSGLACLALLGCAPSTQPVRFDSPSPIQGKIIGVVFDKAIAGNSSGVDDHDLGEFLEAFSAGLSHFSTNVEFRDLTMRKEGAGPYKPFLVKLPRLFADSAKITYQVPGQPPSWSGGDSLDYLFIIQNLSFTGETMGSQMTLRPAGESGSLIKDINGLAPGPKVDLIAPREERTVVDYVLWDCRKDMAVGYNRAELSQHRKFGSETTTFAQDANALSRNVLEKMRNELKRIQ